MLNDITLDQLISRLDKGERTFLYNEYVDELDELRRLTVVETTVSQWQGTGYPISDTLVTAYTPLPSVRCLQPYRALRDLTPEFYKLSERDFQNYASNLKNACSLVARRLVLMEREALAEKGESTPS